MFHLNSKQMLKYGLYDNPVTENPDDCKAIVQDEEKVTVEELIERITGAGSILKETESVAVLHAIFKALGKVLQEGKGFTSDYLVLDHSIKGVFTNAEDSFDPNRHQVCVNVRLGSAMRQMAEGVAVTKVKSSTPRYWTRCMTTGRKPLMTRSPPAVR
jgi:DNA-binding domain